MADLVKNLLEALKLAPRYLVALGLVLGAVILAPAELAQRLGIADVAKDYRSVIGIGFLLCVALLVVTASQWVVAKVGRAWFQRNFKRELHQRLRRLTEDEKQILRFYIIQKTRVNMLRIDDGVVQGLVGSGMIFLSSRMGNVLEGFAHNINEAAWDILNKEPALLSGSTNSYRTDRRDHWLRH